MGIYSRVEPRSGVAETFANVIAPVAFGRRQIRQPSKCQFSYGGRLSQLTYRSILPFCSQQSLIEPPRRVAETGPDEVKNLVYQDQPKETGTGKQMGVEDDVPVTDETRRVDLRAAVR
ncbi:MAG: hypothetical protein JOY54_13280 [Acidobacteriaceae bacterium]|nr:hypothetical protein [Acidobacteriaceae bacterium]